MCNYEASCLACDALPWQFNQPRAYFKGKVVLFSRFMMNASSVRVSEGQRFVTIEFNSTEQGTCLLPLSNIVGKLKDAGAKGVLFVDDSDTPRALIQNGVPRKAIEIPSFDIPRGIGRSVIIFDLLSKSSQDNHSGITVRLPRITGGVAKPPQQEENEKADDGSPPPADNFAGKDSLLIPAWAIGVVVAGSVLLIVGAACTARHIRRIRRMFAYNSLNAAIQTEALADIMAMPAEGDGFTDEPLSDDGEDEWTSSGKHLQMVGLSH